MICRGCDVSEVNPLWADDPEWAGYCEECRQRWESIGPAKRFLMKWVVAPAILLLVMMMLFGPLRRILERKAHYESHGWHSQDAATMALLDLEGPAGSGRYSYEDIEKLAAGERPDGYNDQDR